MLIPDLDNVKKGGKKWENVWHKNTNVEINGWRLK